MVSKSPLSTNSFEIEDGIVLGTNFRKVAGVVAQIDGVVGALLHGFDVDIDAQAGLVVNENIAVLEDNFFVGNLFAERAVVNHNFMDQEVGGCGGQLQNCGIGNSKL